MSDYRISAVAVSDKREVIGQVNRYSLLKELRGRIGNEIRISSFATASPVTVETSSVATAKGLMIRKRNDHIPIINERCVTGIITSNQIASNNNRPGTNRR